MPEVEQVPSAKRGKTIRSAFRPVVWWLIVSLLLVLWDTNRKLLLETTLGYQVFLEGKPVLGQEARLDGKWVQSGSLVIPGRKTISIQEPGLEPFQTNLFIWYGENSAGTIQLRRSKGILNLSISPVPEKLEVRGEHARLSLTNGGTMTATLPVGTYEITETYPMHVVKASTTVVRNETNSLSLSNKLSNLTISAEPADADFVLELQRVPKTSIRGRTPMTITNLPLERYGVDMWRGDYRKSATFGLKADSSTNAFKMVFEYATVRVVTKPDGVKVLEGERELGSTPLTINSLKPGEYRFRLSLDGHGPQERTVKLSAGENPPLEVELVSVAYTEAMQSAEFLSHGGPEQFKLALLNLDQALKARPGDAKATKLKEELQFALPLQLARNAFSNRDYTDALKQVDLALSFRSKDEPAISLKSEITKAATEAAELAKAEARSAKEKQLLVLFEQASSRERDSQLFDSWQMKLRGPLQAVRDAVGRAVGTDLKMPILRNESITGWSFRVDAGMKRGLLGRLQVLVVAGEIAEGETQLYFKVFDFFLGNNVLFDFKDGILESSYVAVHPSYYLTQDPALANNRRAQMVKAVKDAINKEVP